MRSLGPNYRLKMSTQSLLIGSNRTVINFTPFQIFIMQNVPEWGVRKLTTGIRIGVVCWRNSHLLMKIRIPIEFKIPMCLRILSRGNVFSVFVKFNYSSLSHFAGVNQYISGVILSEETKAKCCIRWCHDEDDINPSCNQGETFDIDFLNTSSLTCVQGSQGDQTAYWNQRWMCDSKSHAFSQLHCYSPFLLHLLPLLHDNCDSFWGCMSWWLILYVSMHVGLFCSSTMCWLCFSFF